MARRKSSPWAWVLGISGIFVFLYIWQVGFSSTDTEHFSKVNSFPVSIPNNNIEITENFGVVFDLGSSGSRANIFTWNRHPFGDCSVAADGGFQTLRQIANMKSKPGIGALELIPDKAGDSLLTLWEFVNKHVPAEKRAETPIFMFATAGLRVIAEKNHEKLYDDDDVDDNVILEPDDDEFQTSSVSQILTNLRQYVRHKSGYSLIRDDHIRVLTGQEEGVFDFITVQQSLRLNPDAEMGGDLIEWENAQILLEPSSLENGLYPVGTIDLGGASTQISFVPEPSSSDSSPRVAIGAFSDAPVNQPKIFTHSFLDYGINRAYERYLDLLIDSSDSEYGSIADPCLFRDSENPVSKNGRLYHFSGTGDEVRCKQTIQKLFHSFSGSCGSPPCAFSEVHIPPIPANTKFIAFDHAFRVSHALLLRGYFPFISLYSASAKLLERSWSDAQDMFQAVAAEDLKKLPFEGMYVYGLLQFGYQLDRTKSELIGFADTVDNNRISWALGAMAYHANTLCKKSLL